MKFASILVVALLIGCHSASSQVPPTQAAVTITGTTQAVCPSCSYIFSRIALASGATACPAPNVTTPNYTPLNQGSPATTVNFSDTNAAGTTVCYIAQTIQPVAGQPAEVSQPSNAIGPFVVPSSPLAPVISATVAKNEVLPNWQIVAKLEAPHLRGEIKR